MRAARSFIISKGDQHLNTASLYLHRELAPAELQGYRKDDEEMSPDQTTQRKKGKGEGGKSLHETEPQGPGTSLFLKNTAIPPLPQQTSGVCIQYVSVKLPRDTVH